ncbi:MAG TPA: FAD-dependent oxidoreductase [Terriglobales bacterium]|nr:FAD-dependent oxidoreductase [Terriglobales bacterium]
MAKIVVIGGGVAGLTVAHELAERGFDVHVYESRTSWGGKARTQPVIGTGTDRRRDLPGEHGFRFYPRFYRHVIDTMARIPTGDGSGASVESRLRPCTEAGVALADNRPWLRFQRRKLIRPYEILEGIDVLFQQLGFEGSDAGLFGLKVLQFLASSEERRLQDYERISWWDYLGGNGYSKRCQECASGIPRMMVAMDARNGNARTIGTTSMQLLADFATTGIQNDRTMGGPTSQMWINPWTDHLKTFGVQFHPGKTCVGFELSGREISGARFGGGQVIKADHYILAVPIECAKALISPNLASIDPQCERLREANVDQVVSWMVGIQFYLYEDVPLARGHMVFPDAPWALTAISQPQFWSETLGNFRRHFGNGEVGGLLSVDISEWERPGKFVEKRAKECTPEEIKHEVWSQLKLALNMSGTDGQTLTDDNLHSWHLDDDLDYSAGLPPLNGSRLLVHPPGSWALRPDASSGVPNLCFAGDYVRTHTDIASMEAACEAGRRAANVVLDREGRSDSRAGVWSLQEPAEFDHLKQLDAELLRVGRPHLFEIAGVKHAFEAADLVRRLSQVTGLSYIENLARQFRITDVVNNMLGRFGVGR